MRKAKNQKPLSLRAKYDFEKRYNKVLLWRIDQQICIIAKMEKEIADLRKLVKYRL